MRRLGSKVARVSDRVSQRRGAQYERQDLCRHRRLDLRALARGFLSKRPAAEARARIRQPAPDLDRDQWYLLLDLQARKLGEMARRDAGELRVLGEGVALLHQSPRAR